MPLSDYLQVGEILTSPQLAQRLVDAGRTGSAARKAISRSKDPAVSILPVHLPRRARLFTRRESARNPDFYDALATAIADLRPGLARTIRALLTRRVLLKADAQRLLAAPLQPRPSRVPTYSAEVSVLLALELCDVEAEETPLERLTVRSLFASPHSHQYARTQIARQIVNARLTRILTDQFRKQAAIGWQSVVLPNRETGTVQFSDYVFSAFAYSWLDPLLRRAVGQKPKPTPVLFDVFSRDCDVHDVAAFLHRLRRVGSNRNARMPLLGVIAAYTFTEEAWSSAKKGGLLSINLRQAFGNTALEALARMEHLLSLAVTGDPFGNHATENDYDGLADDIEALRVHPYVAELRALGLEILTAVLLRAQGWEDVRLRTIVELGDAKREVDVVGRRRGDEEVYVVECKAAHEERPLDPKHVRKFFSETVPAMLKTLPNAKRCVAEIWTTGRLGEAATAALKEIPPAKRVHVRLRNKADIVSLIPSTLSPCKRLVETLSLPK